MRPLKIIITGFCSYGKTTEIDLEKLGTSGLYLITGKTGSGKTTLFDAITYALYGEPSGNNRETYMLRSNFAGPDLPTEVELTFELRGQKYHIKRNPSYERQAKRGEGFTVESANALLTMPDGKILEGPKTVDKKIIELMGIDRSQFSQIVMLAQGDFQKLLTESTIVRQEIFRKLFKTDNYQKLQKRLTEKQKDLNTQVGNLSRELNLFFQGTQCDYDSVNSLELSKAKEVEMSWAEKIALIEKIIQEDKEKQVKFEQAEIENNKKLDEILIQLKEVQDIKTARDNLNTKKIEIETAVENIANSKKTLEEAEQQLELNPEKERKVTLIQNDLDKYEQVTELEEKIEGLSKDIASAQTSVNSGEEKIQNQKKLIESVEKEIKEIEAAGDKSAELAVEESQLTVKKQNISDFQTQLQDYSVLSKELEKAQKEYAAESEKALELQQLYLEKNKLFLDGQAGVLADTLVENQPCPVCGSIHHPSPAKKQSAVPTEKELNDFKIQADKQSKIAEEKSTAASSLKGRAQSEQADVEKNKAIYFPDTESQQLDKAVQKALENLEIELLAVKNKLDAEGKRKERKATLAEKLPEYQAELNKLTENLAELTTRISVNETSRKHFVEQKEDAQKKLQFASKQDAEKEIKRLEGEVAFAKQAHETAQEVFHKEELNLKHLQGAAQELEEQLKNAKTYDEEKLTASKAVLETEASKLSDGLKQIFARIQTNENAVNKIKPDSKELIEKQNKQQLLIELTNTANGNLGQKKAKIMLETYVQMHYFDRIIAHANKRFMIMSGGQYELVRKKEADNAQSQTGLELNVIDHYKGKERDVKSLSGGESFEASLSLALGLSDEIAESAGGIRIDSMFVDEGFGTLDSDTLQKAYNALVSVTEGNRLVGIISHVDFLKEKIDRQVVITKEPDSGSSVTIKL